MEQTLKVESLANTTTDTKFGQEPTRPKVLLIDFSGYGVMTHVLSFLDQADHTRWNYSVLFATDDLRPGVDGYRDALAQRGITSYSIPVRQSLQLSDLAALAKTVSIINQVRPSLIHCHSSKAGAIGRPAATICGVPVVFTPHSFSFQLAPVGSKKRKILTQIERVLGKLTYGVATVSETERSLAVNEGIAPDRRVHLIPNGVDLAQCQDATRHRNETRTKLGISADASVVCFVGRIAPQKMPHIVVDAAKILKANQENCPIFLMIGNGPLENVIDDLIKSYELQSHVRRLGWLSHDDTLRVLASSDVMVLPSLYEGLPYVALEAQAVRTLPILTDVPGSRDAVIHRKTGLVVPVNDPRALADAVWEVISDTQYREEIENAGVIHIEKNYSSKQMAVKIEALYTSAIDKAIK